MARHKSAKRFSVRGLGQERPGVVSHFEGNMRCCTLKYCLFVWRLRPPRRTNTPLCWVENSPDGPKLYRWRARDSASHCPRLEVHCYPAHHKESSLFVCFGGRRVACGSPLADFLWTKSSLSFRALASSSAWKKDKGNEFSANQRDCTRHDVKLLHWHKPYQ